MDPKVESAKPKVDRKLLLNTHTFTINIQNAQGFDYSGTFVVHRPSMGELIKIGVKEASDLGGLTNVDFFSSSVAHMICTLEVVVDTHPDWWKPREIKDMEVIQEVFEKLNDYLKQFQIKPKQESEGTSQG